MHEAEFADPGVVKVVTDPAGYALYFSRSLIPYPRQRTPQFTVFEHLGLYAYTRSALMRLAGCRHRHLKKSKASSSCARSRTVFASSWWKLHRGRKCYRWTRRLIWSGRAP